MLNILNNWDVVYFTYVGLVIAMYVNSNSITLAEKKTDRKAVGFVTNNNSTHGSTVRMNRSVDDSDAEEDAVGGTELSDLDVLLGRHNVVDDIEEAVVISTHSNFCERTFSWINHCIATPISAVLSWVMPQLHPTSSTAWISSTLSALSNRGASDSSNGRTSGSDFNSVGGAESDDTESLLRSNSLDNYMMHQQRLSPTQQISSSVATAEGDRSAEKVPLWRAILVLVISILCIGFLAGAIVSLSESMVRHMGIGTSTLGATLVALGAEVSFICWLVLRSSYRVLDSGYD